MSTKSAVRSLSLAELAGRYTCCTLSHRPLCLLAAEAVSAEEQLQRTVTAIDAEARILRGTVDVAFDDELLDSMVSLVCENIGKFTNAKTLSQKREILSQSDMHTIAVVSQDGKRLYGFASCKTETENEVRTDYLYELHTDKEVRKKGLGSALMAVVESTSQHKGSKRMTLTVHKKNKHALHFYKLRGYIVARHSNKLGDWQRAIGTAQAIAGREQEDDA